MEHWYSDTLCVTLFHERAAAIAAFTLYLQSHTGWVSESVSNRVIATQRSLTDIQENVRYLIRKADAAGLVHGSSVAFVQNAETCRKGMFPFCVLMYPSALVLELVPGSAASASLCGAR